MFGSAYWLWVLFMSFVIGTAYSIEEIVLEMMGISMDFVRDREKNKPSLLI